MNLSPAQAEWLVTFFRNVPGAAQVPREAAPQQPTRDAYVGHEPASDGAGYDYDCYPVIRY